MLPNFLIAGAAKSGSSSLFYYLGKHPDVLTSKVKEPGFFTKYWREKDLAWYESFFDHWAGESAIGEATVEYMVDENAPGRISQVLPNVKLIFILRNPVERAWSHYWHRVKNGEERRSFEDILSSGDKDEYPIKYGLYATQIERYLQFFDITQMKFVILDDFKEAFKGTIQGIFHFLGVDPTYRIDYEGKINVARIYRIKQLSYVAHAIRSSDRIKNLIPSTIYPLFQRPFRFLDELNKRPFQLPPLPVRHREYLQKLYSEEIKRLQGLIGRDLSAWQQET